MAPEACIPETLDRHGPLATQAGPRAPDNLGRFQWRQRTVVHAAEQRDVVVVDDAGEQRVARHQSLRPARFLYRAPLAGQQIVQRHGLSRSDGLDFPHREPRGALRVQPAPFLLRAAASAGIEVGIDDRLPAHLEAVDRPRPRELCRLVGIGEVACERFPRLAEFLQGEPRETVHQSVVHRVRRSRGLGAGLTVAALRLLP